MKYDLGMNIKALIVGAAIAILFIIFGFKFSELFYPFSAIGLIYAGYGQNNLKVGTLMGALASIPIIILYLKGYLGQLTGFYATTNGILAAAVIIILIGMIIGFIGAWTKKSRVKALKEHEKKQKIGKKKKKNKK